MKTIMVWPTGLLLAACAGAAAAPVVPAAATSTSPSSSAAPSAMPQHSLAKGSESELSLAPPAGPEPASPGGTRGVTLAPSAADGPSAVPSPTAAPSLSTYFAAREASGAMHPLVSGDTLRSGDHFWLELSAYEPLYVYVLYVAADRSASVLYPSAGDLVLTPGHVQRLPESQDFELDQHTGLEHLIVVASRQVLSRSASSLSAIVERVRTTHRFATTPKNSQTKAAATGGAARAAPARPAATEKSVSADRAVAAVPYTGPTTTLEPDYSPVNTRGIVLSGSPRGRVDVVPDSAGVIALPLLIEHRP